MKGKRDRKSYKLTCSLVDGVLQEFSIEGTSLIGLIGRDE